MLLESTKMDLRDYGAYCIVLDLIYHYGGAVRDDARMISGYMRGCNGMGWKNIRGRLIAEGHFYEDGDTLRSPRVDAELKEATRIREANAMGGHIAQAIKRRAKGLSHPTTDRPGHPPGHWSKSEMTAAKTNGLGEVHSSYPHTQPQTQTEGRLDGLSEEEGSWREPGSGGHASRVARDLERRRIRTAR